MPSSEIITAKGLSASYRGEHIWNNANFSIKKGSFVGVLGPNGAGKTTLFRILLGLMNPSSGSISLFGTSPTRGNPRIGYVPQRHLIDAETTIEAREFVRLGINGNHWGVSLPTESKREYRESMEALRAVGAENLAHKPLGNMSGGELQRVFLAQALVGNPELLLLDEPLANLDIKRESDLVELVGNIVKARGVTVLLIAHNINPLLPVLDQVIYMAQGHIATGSPKDILQSDILSALYGTPVEVLHDSRGRIVIISGEEGSHHHHE